MQQFRELIPPGTTFEFMGKRRQFVIFSVILTVVCLLMLPLNAALRGSMLNWTIDFKGGTEIIAGFPEGTKDTDVRKAMEAAGYTQVDVSSYVVPPVDGKAQAGFIVRIAEFGAVTKEQADKVGTAIAEQLKDKGIQKTQWSGDQLFIRSKKTLTEAELAAIFTAQGLEMKPWNDAQRLEATTSIAGTEEYNLHVALFGLDRKVKQHLEKSLSTAVDVKQVDSVGAKAGDKLRNDGLASLLYAIAFILVYIAFRFDLRYGPGTVFSLVHDAIVVIGVFAVTWQEVSLTTVAALLTVIGYSMNDTIVLFDRIRENEERLKDKKFDRVVNISINEVLSRTLLTSTTTFAVTLAMNLLGAGVVRNFAFAMNVGVIVGTYSSIFVAAPTIIWLNSYYGNRLSRPRSMTAQPST